MKATDSRKIIVSHKLDNGLQVTIYDHCRLIAGDRWYVKISCEISGKYIQDECRGVLNDEQTQAFLEKYADGVVTFTYTKDRNFVDDGVKEEILHDLVEQIEVSNLGYMAKDSFAENLLKKTMDEFILEFNVRKEIGLLGGDEDVEEPDDFSACFK
jgi:hypothetical protein